MDTLSSKLEYLLSNSITNDQRTEEWYRRRYDMLTASDCASSLESNPFQTKQQLFIKKTKPFTMADYTKNPIDAVEHGIKYEPIASSLYERFEATKVNEVGLYVHPKYKWLGASPDGITDTGKLIEIKCIFRRYLYEEPPLYYWIQTQIQMEVTDLDECDLFQCKFIEYKSKKEYINDKKTSLKGFFDYKGTTHYWKLEQYKCTNIKRDKRWFRRSILQMKKFWSDVMTTRKNQPPSTPQLKPLKATKRTRTELESESDIDDETAVPPPPPMKRQQSKAISLSRDNVYTDWNEWVSGNNTRNYVLRDPVLDYFNLYGKSQGIKTDSEIDLSLDSGKHLKEQATNFETAIFDNIVHRIGETKVLKIGSYEEAYSSHKFNLTVKAMKKGYPVIFKAVLHDITTRTYGIAEMLCRSDYLKKIFENNPFEEPKLERKKAPKLSKTSKYHYVIVDIKGTTLRFYRHSETLCNDPQMKVTKCKNCVHNNILGNIQGFTPPQSYIIGKRTKDVKEIGNNPFEVAGIIDYTERDEEFQEISKSAIEWYRRVKTEGAGWSLYPPSTPELYPNMSNGYDNQWHSAKKELAHRTKDITVLWFCGPEQRVRAHANKIYSWDDPSCTAEILGFKNVRAKQLNAILKANRTTKSSILPLVKDIPTDAKKFITPVSKPNSLEYYVDFETVSNSNTDFDKIRYYKPDKFSYEPKGYANFIYMIGFGWYNPKDATWNHRSYMVDKITNEEEKRVVAEFVQDMYNIKQEHGWKRDQFPNIYHWGHAELTTLLKAIERSPVLIKPLEKHRWINLLNFFKSVPITIKGTFSFGLKDVVKGLYSANLIPTHWPDTDIDGRAAMYAVINADKRCQETKTPLSKDGDMKQITKYNEVDCKVMFEILEYLRQHYLPKFRSKYFKNIGFTPYSK